MDHPTLSGDIDPSGARPIGAVRRERVDEQIVRILVDAVIDGRWPSGSALPPERQLAEQLDVNRTSLRRALARLEQMGLIVGRQGSGNIVQDPSELTAPEIVRSMMRRFGPELLDEILEVRTGLGGLIGRLAAERATDAEVDALRAALADLEELDGPEALQQAEMSFFLQLVGATHNGVLGALVRWIDATYGQLPEEFAGAFGDGAEVRQGLRGITRAVARRQPNAAARAVTAYFESSGARLTEAGRSVFSDGSVYGDGSVSGDDPTAPSSTTGV